MEARRLRPPRRARDALLRRPAAPGRPPRAANVGRAQRRLARVDRQRRGLDSEHGYCALAHVWHHPLPQSRGFPHHAGGTHDAVVEAAKFLHQESRVGCTAQLLQYAEQCGGE